MFGTSEEHKVEQLGRECYAYEVWPNAKFWGEGASLDKESRLVMDRCVSYRLLCASLEHDLGKEVYPLWKARKRLGWITEERVGEYAMLRAELLLEGTFECEFFAGDKRHDEYRLMSALLLLDMKRGLVGYWSCGYFWVHLSDMAKEFLGIEE